MASATAAERYRLEKLLNASPMAEVWSATDLVLDRSVVVKLLAPDADRPRFDREARAAAALGHPNIVQLFDYGDDDGRPYIVFEYLRGGSLEERLADSTALSGDEAARVATDIAAGLAHAHERNVVHRDLKPANVLFDDEGRAKIADFGIALLADANTLTETGTILGTAAYISPEQTRGEPATPASDVYSFGVLLYRMLTGRLPFESVNPVELAAMHRDAEPPPLVTVSPEVSERLVAVAMTALAKAPQSRPRDGAALVSSLARSAQPSDPADADTRILDPRLPHRRNWRPTPAVAGLSLALLAAAGIVSAFLVTTRQGSAPAVPLQSSPAQSTRHMSTPPATDETSVSSSTSSRPATTTTAATIPSAPEGITVTSAPTATTDATPTLPTTTSEMPTTTSEMPTTTP